MKHELESKFWELCNKAQSEDDRELGITPKFGELLFEILEFVKSHPKDESEFKKYFIHLGLNPAIYTEWILLFCMRELRYPEVLEAINTDFAKRGGVSGAPRSMNFVSAVNWVYDDSPWEYADFFKYYWEKENPGKSWPLELKNA